MLRSIRSRSWQSSACTAALVTVGEVPSSEVRYPPQQALHEPGIWLCGVESSVASVALLRGGSLRRLRSGATERGLSLSPWPLLGLPAAARGA